MKATYTAIDGVSEIGSETLVSLCQEDSVKGGNLLSNPASINTWTAGGSGSLSQQDNLTIKLTNTTASTGYASKSITTIASTYYLIRAYAYTDGIAGARIYAGTAAGVNNLGTSTATTSNKIHEVVFKASGTTTYISFQNNAGASNIYSYWSSIEVLELEHLGVDETTELQTNGDFSASPGTTGWTAGSNTTLSIVSGAIRVTSVSNGVSYVYQAITTESGKMYQFTVDLVTDGATGGAFVYAGTTAGNSDLGYYATSGVPGTYTIYFKASGTTTYISMAGSSSELAAEYFEWDNAVVTETGELVQNGGFNKDFLWTKGTGWTISGGSATFASTTSPLSAATLYQTNVFDVTKNYDYIITLTVSGRTSGNMYIQFGGTTIPDTSTLITADGTYTYTAKSGKATSNLSFVASATFDGSIDNVSVRRAVTDISSNGDGLEVHGEIVLVPVNYNSTTVAYANFSADNYLKQPYNSNLDPGTGDFSLSFWFKNSGNSGVETIIHRDSSTTAQNYGCYLNSSGNLVCYVDDDTSVRSVTSTTVLDDDQWHFISFVYDQDFDTTNCKLYLYVDGSEDNTTTNTVLNTLNNTSAILNICAHVQDNSPFDNGKSCITKIDIGTLWTAQQSKSMYDDEKVLFNQNEIYSVVGDALTLGIKVTNSNPGQQTKKIVNEALDGTREFVQINQKKTFSCQTVPVNFSDKNKVFKFLRSVEAQSFTFSERSFEYGADNQMTVYKETSNEQLNRLSNSDDLYTVNFTVRER